MTSQVPSRGKPCQAVIFCNTKQKVDWLTSLGLDSVWTPYVDSVLEKPGLNA